MSNYTGHIGHKVAAERKLVAPGCKMSGDNVAPEEKKSSWGSRDYCVPLYCRRDWDIAEASMGIVDYVGVEEDEDIVPVAQQD